MLSPVLRPPQFNQTQEMTTRNTPFVLITAFLLLVATAVGQQRIAVPGGSHTNAGSFALDNAAIPPYLTPRARDVFLGHSLA